MSWLKRRSALRAWAVLAGLGLMATGLDAAQVFKYRKAKPEKGYLIQTVPYEKWLKINFCGPACLAMVLNSLDERRSFSQRAIAGEIFDSGSQATYNSELVLYPRTKGFESYSFRGSLQALKDLVQRDIPVIVLTKTVKQLAKGHYRVVIGFDDDRGQIIFHDPLFGGRRAMKVESFLKVWEMGQGWNQSRWMMAVVRDPSTLPPSALPGSPLTSINLATAYYRRSDYARSKEMWEKVRESLETDPYPLYSLGMVSLRQGKFDEAAAYARAALGVDAESAYALDVLGLAYANQGEMLLAFQTLGLARRSAPREKFIKAHYLQVRALYIERARLEYNQRNKKGEGE
jgi:tetratricopeptide (TPR) repeat protein